MDNGPADPRDHGLPNESRPIAPPEIATDPLAVSCPLCECRQTFGIKVGLDNPELGKSWGHYRGCAACVWASAMTVVPETTVFPTDGYCQLK